MSEPNVPDASAALVARCGDRGFTPGVKDVPGLLALLASANAPRTEASDQVKSGKLAKQIVKALARGDLPVAAALLTGSDNADANERVVRLRAAGQITQRLGDATFTSVFVDALEDPDAKVVREGIRALGKFDEPLPEAQEAAIVAVLLGAALPEQRAAADTLGRRGGARSEKALRGIHTDDEDLARRIGQAITLLERRALREQPTQLVLDRSLPRRAQMILRCRSGSAAIVARHAVAVLHRDRNPRNAPVDVVGPTEISLSWAGTLGELYEIRSVTEVGLVFGLPRGGSLEDRIVNGLTGSDLSNALRSWTDGPIRFRLTFTSGGSRGPLVWNVARRLAEQAADLTNDSRDVSWSVEVDEHKSGRILCIPRNASVRFPYRQADVPAASHPTLAALMAWVARPVAGDVIWDPFCGSGTELIECARLEPNVKLHGSDRDTAAIDAARQNVEAARLGATPITLRTLDALDPDSPTGVSLIITNPPMGHRVAADGKLEDFLRAFIQRAATVLRPGGRLVWVTPQRRLSEEAGEAAGLHVHDHGPVDLGGLRANLQVMRRL